MAAMVVVLIHERKLNINQNVRRKAVNLRNFNFLK